LSWAAVKIGLSPTVMGVLSGGVRVGAASRAHAVWVAIAENATATNKVQIRDFFKFNFLFSHFNLFLGFSYRTIYYIDTLGILDYLYKLINI
jgi:hypothetical protein